MHSSKRRLLASSCLIIPQLLRLNRRRQLVTWSLVNCLTLTIYSTAFALLLVTTTCPSCNQVMAGPIAVEMYSKTWDSFMADAFAPGSMLVPAGFPAVASPNKIVLPRADAPPAAAPAAETVATLQATKPKLTIMDKKRYQEELIRNWPESDGYVRKKYQVWRNKIIPFFITDEFPDDERKIILGAIAEVEANSCIRFVKHSNETDYVKFIKSEPGCFSHVGHQGGEQWVNLSNDSACVRHALVVHELMHVLGWFHEHSRPDRDQFIKIFWHNVLEEYKDNFRVFDDDQIFDVGLLPYDYHSVTHYHSGAFSRFGLLPTLTNWENRQMTLGNSRGLSPGDVQKLRRGYACGNAESQPKFVVLLAGSARDNTLVTSPNYVTLLTFSLSLNYYYVIAAFVWRK